VLLIKTGFQLKLFRAVVLEQTGIGTVMAEG